MLLKNSWYAAISRRSSRRTYKRQQINPQKIEQIKNLINTINEESGLHIQFVENGNEFLNGFKASYGLISGMPSLIAMAGNEKDEDLKRKIGYYGEFLVLESVSLGLGTCWISGTYNRDACKRSIELKENENLICVIAIGNVSQNKNAKELLISQFGKSKQSFDELLSEKDCTPPLWVANGIEAARTAPSAVNGKPIAYRFQKDQLSAFVSKKNHNAEEIDLGISLAHFQLGAIQGLKEGVWIKEGNVYTYR